MSNFIKTQYSSVYYRLSEKDKTFYIKYKKDGELKTELIGKESEGITTKKAYDTLNDRKKDTNKKESL